MAQSRPVVILGAAIAVAAILVPLYQSSVANTLQGVAVVFVLPALVFIAIQWLSWLRASRVLRAVYQSVGSTEVAQSSLQFLAAQIEDLARTLSELNTPEGYVAEGGEVFVWLQRMHETAASPYAEVRWVKSLTELSAALDAQEATIHREGLRGGIRILVMPLAELRELFRGSSDVLREVMEVHRSNGIPLMWVSPELAGGVADRHRVPPSAVSISLWTGQYALSAARVDHERQRFRLTFEQADLAEMSAYVSDLRQLAVPIEDSFLLSDREPPDQLEGLILTLLDRDGAVGAADLPLRRDRADAALKQFARIHRDLALTNSSIGLEWARSTAVRSSGNLVRSFEGETAITAVGDLLAAVAADWVLEGPNLSGCVLTLPSDPILPTQLLVTASPRELNARLIDEIADTATRLTSTSRLAVHVAQDIPSHQTVMPDAILQKSTAVNIVTLRPETLLALARGAGLPRDGVVNAVLRQADLAKVSPFVLRSATPEEMYFGREQEQAQVLASLHANSVAVLGGRMIGKTSFLYRMNSALAKAGFASYLADCQTVSTWQQFIALAERVWKVQLGATSYPEGIFDLIEQLSARSAGKTVVLILDEVDKLLEWDRLAKADASAPDEMFRAFRSASQERGAQFIFSGERTIARRLADPNSPHWNFCEPLFLRQLTMSAASELLVQPLESLQVSIVDEAKFAQAAWDVTSGHPQITQFLGDRLVRALAERDADDRVRLSSVDLDPVVESFEFRRHYLETYWGQAEPLERLISVRIGEGVGLPSELRTSIACHVPDVSSETIDDALRVLELLGVIEQGQRGYQLRARWLPHALSVQGDVAAFAEQLAAAVR